MTLPVGQISLGQVNTELGLSSTTLISLNQANVRALAGVASGQIAMSNLQGKSNASNFIASLYDPSATLNSNSSFYATASSSSAIYVVGESEQPATTNYLTVASYTATGSLNWKKYMSTTNASPTYPNNTPYAACDSSGNLYFTQSFGSSKTLFKLNSSGAVVWQKTVTSLVGPITIDSSDGIYLSGITSSTKTTLIKLDTSGALVWGREYTYSTPVSQGGINTDIPTSMSNGSGYVYQTFSGTIRSGTTNYPGHFVVKTSTAGTYAAVAGMSGGGTSNGPYATSSAVDASGNLLVVGTYGSSQSYTFLFSIDPSLPATTPTWQIYLGASPQVVTPTGVTVDSSSNVYLSARATISNVKYFASAKYNSSGTIQWQRGWRETAQTQENFAYAIGLTGAGKLAVTGKIYNSSFGYGASMTLFTTVVPTDGTATGTYTMNGGSYTYGAISATTGSETFSYYLNPALTATTVSYTPTLTTTSYAFSDVTYLSSSVTTL
jgi:hypothetical protein